MRFRRRQSKLKEMTRLMKKLDQQVSKCSRCGMCQSVCPLYSVTGKEDDVARGKLMLLDGLMQEFFENPDGVSERLNRCLLCGSCNANCPRGVSIIEIFLNARAVITEYKGLSFFKKIIFRRVLSNPELFDRTVALATRWQYLFSTKRKIDFDESCTQLISPLLSARQIVPLAPVPFHKMDHGPLKSTEPDSLKVAFFVGCLLDKIFPDIARKIVDVLAYHGVEVIVPESQGCCSIPALSSGDKETFNRLLDYHVSLFNPDTYDYLVTGCATCTATIKKIWPAMGDVDTEKGLIVNHIAEKVYDINQFLIEIIGVSPLKANPPEKANQKEQPGPSRPIVTYHDPCHLRKTLNIYSEPRAIICMNDKYLYREMTDAESCCGMGGSFNLAHYNLSTEIGEKKASHIKNVSASVVATGCPACMIQMADILKKGGMTTRIAHTIEIYSEKIL